MLFNKPRILMLAACGLIFYFLPGCAEVQKPSLDAASYVERGITYSNKRQYDKAISDFTKAIEIKPKNPLAYHQRGLNYMIYMVPYNTG